MQILRSSIFFFLLLQLISCSGPETYIDQTKNRAERMTPERRDQIAPNELFLAVLNGDIAHVAELIAKQPHLMNSKNLENGNTPLALAIELHEIEIARLIFDRLSVEDFFSTNDLGEGLVFQAARSGLVWMIEELAERYYQSLGVLNDYEFKNLDQENLLGQRALHVAKNSQVAEALKVQYYRGFLELPFWEFTFKRDLQGKNFLHTAALEGRHDLLRWAVDHMCSENQWETEGGWIRGSLGFAYHRAQRLAQTYIGGFWLDYDLKFNQRDSFGKTPLHYSALSRNFETVRIVSSCKWVDYSLSDNEGNSVLQNFLLSVPENLTQVPGKDLEILSFLMAQQTVLKKWVRTITDEINSTNHVGDTALHIAARLTDPRIFQMLSEKADVERKNAQGLSAQELFLSKQKTS